MLYSAGAEPHSRRKLRFIHRGLLSLSDCDPVNYGLPGFSVREKGFLQARILEPHWPILVAIPF